MSANNDGKKGGTGKSTSGEESSLLMDHNYDGIQEFDYPLPNWWLATFIFTVIFGVIYYIVYQFGYAPSLKVELATDLAAIRSTQNAGKSSRAESEASLAAVAKDPTKIAGGKATYGEKCAVCHGPQGQGVIGPNLTDDYWIHGKGTLYDISETIENGVPDKGMPPWGPLLSRDELMNVTAFIKTLRGTNPANPKAPQGELVKD